MKFIYKCRMCGQEFAHHLEVGDPTNHLIILSSETNTGILRQGWDVSIREQHKHEDGSIGMADLIGSREKLEWPT